MIWVIGCNGMLGKEITCLLNDQNIKYVSSDIEVDITNVSKLRDFTTNKNISWIINCSAYTAVDKAEDEVDLCYKINHIGVKNIAIISKEISAKLIHISTDYVFSGIEDKPLNENDITEPVSVYGKSKLAGENEIKSICTEYFIIRTAWLYGKYGKNFVYTMIKLFNERSQLKVVNDQYGSPTNAEGLAHLIFKICSENSQKYGIYHYTDEGRINWYEFSKKIYQFAKEYSIISNEVEIIEVGSSEYLTKAKRPFFSYMDKSKVKSIYSEAVLNWEVQLKIFFDKYEQFN
ncbi:MAG: dTDP-4-dehydrorhamnose reductase [Spirochaetes bacterium GWF1_31_7]|nr:MAG: dTDP-4-dehydrorhamnose reductase [Spirochaetes bacterium GWE1_32_154]OHD47033.1 MAG: dTDP-4-dehydrorhamnose reductase [Spirochaetes bacterium GWE2_31_10]OHD51982.1 MAG: dTDP-4-dehydrorhamnose reductase [Spirochaetes bacterium GWF1_31_7]OHD76421.1 MAG: dTDP-4-dehydrorhamnose reductase [Spirochaetes bacterium RIFOXYB1_FULL_32_8]HBD94260.1 dTDP-4-dehydrorhamnose reductase [Spirochaetia bacterium]